jgi:hypothetical protein
LSDAPFRIAAVTSPLVVGVRTLVVSPSSTNRWPV